MKTKRIAVFSAVVLMLGLLAGCSFRIDPDTLLHIKQNFRYASYEHADEYTAGDYTYSAADVKEIRISWVGGSVDVVQSDSAELTVSENSVDLSADAQCHSLLKDGILTVHFCASDFSGEIDSSQKSLTVEIPAGAVLVVDTVSADTAAEELSAADFAFNSVSGNMTVGRLTSDAVEVNTVSGGFSADEVSANTFSFGSVSGGITAHALSVDQFISDTTSGDVELEIVSCREADIDTVSGRTVLTLPADGATVRYQTSSGVLKSQREYRQEGFFYGFGPAESKISVNSVSGDLKIE